MSLTELNKEDEFQKEVMEHPGYAAVLMHMPT